MHQQPVLHVILPLRPFLLSSPAAPPETAALPAPKGKQQSQIQQHQQYGGRLLPGMTCPTVSLFLGDIYNVNIAYLYTTDCDLIYTWF